LLGSAILIVAGLAAYENSFRGILVFDDEPAIAENSHLRRIWPLTDAMSSPKDTTLSGRPVASLTFALDVVASGANSSDAPAALGSYHATNLAIHLLAGLTLAGVVRRTLMTPRLRDAFGEAGTILAATVAVIWTVHPLQTASVTYVVQRVESLMGLFYLLTLYCAIRALTPATRARHMWTAGAIVTCALGMGTKEVMASAPLIVFVWDWLFVPDRRVRRWPLYAGLCATWIVLASLAAGGPRSFSVGFGFPQWPWWRYLMTQAGVVVHYLRLSVVPTPLVLDYDWPPSTSVLEVLPPAALLVLLIGVTVWGLIRRHPAAFAGVWFFAILGPTSSVVPLVTEVAAEHRMYLPLAAVVTSVVIGAFATGRRLGPDAIVRARFGQVGLVSAALVVCLFALMTHRRNADYADYERIWSDTIAKRPRNARARNNYATALVERQAFREAEPHLRVAVDLNPEFAEAQANLGVALCAQGSFGEGIAHLQRAVEIQPDYASAYRNMAEAYASQGQMAAAVSNYAKALSFRPNDVDLLNRIAWILATTDVPALRDGPRALQLAERATRLTNRQEVISLDTLAAALAELDRFEAAVTTAREALDLARSRGESAIVPELEDRLRLYRSGRRFRQAVRQP